MVQNKAEFAEFLGVIGFHCRVCLVSFVGGICGAKFTAKHGIN
jgi:hypothetical protein